MALRDRLRRLVQKPGSVDLAPFRAVVDEANRREERVRGLTDAGLTAAAAALRVKKDRAEEDSAEENRAGEDLAELCAVGREAARRTLGERPYDVQLIGALALLSGHVAEMATGEGKTLAGALAAAGYALRGRRVHVLSVNDYLARRDARWMGPLHELLGVSTGWVGQASTPAERRAAYAADVTYAPVSEVGFDLLRDRLVTSAADLVLPGPSVALVDEADSVLVDEAMVPLVLAGATGEDAADPRYAALVRRLRPGLHYDTDAEARNVRLTAAGAREVERALGVDLYDAANLAVLTGVNVALHAEVLLHRDVDYIVRDGAVRLVSESRGRVALLQRWPDGLQAAVEAKEELAASPGGEILDSVTVQELIGRYPVRCGMTGTAMAVAGQLTEFYGLQIAVVPPHRPCVRVDEPDRLYATAADKEVAIVEEIAAAHDAGRPVLVGTGDVAESERLARRLARAGLDRVVLNAKNDAEEAAIIAAAGAPGAITVSTQMAGRGTDIRLGGAPESGAPESGAPESGAPESGAPESGAPESGASGSGASGNGASASDAAEGGAAGSGAPEGGASASGASRDGAAAGGAAGGDALEDGASPGGGSDGGDAGALPGTAPADAGGAARERVAAAGGLLVIGTGRYHSSRLDDQLRGRAGRQGDPGGSVFFTSLQDDLVTRYAPGEKAGAAAAADGRVHDKGAHWIVGHAQRVAEGVDLEIHRNTWRYHHLIGLQRGELLAERDAVLRGDRADRAMAEDAPDRHAGLTAAAGAAAVAAAARQVVLYELDRRWAEHLAYLADLREGIHLRSLGRGLDPLVEFHREAVPAGKRVLPEARERAAAAFRALTASEDGVDLAAADLKRPSATWTYLVHDNPFGSLDERALSGLIAMFKPGRRSR